MDGSPRKAGRPSLRDLGFPRAPLCLWLLASGVVPAVTALLAGAGGTAVLALWVGGATTALAGALLGARRLSRSLVQPLEELGTALDQIGRTGHAPRLHEHGAPLLQPMLRRFNLATMAIDQRTQLSHANRLSIEAAFDRVHAVLQSLREGVVVVDASGRIVLANRSARRLLRGDERLEGKQLLELVDGDLRTALQNGLARVDAGQATEMRTADVAYDGRIYDVDVVQVQTNRPDQDFGRVVVLADVTRNHEVNRLKDELLSSISHELRTPLTNMCSSSEILAGLTAADEAEWREFVTMLNAESHRLKLLVDDVMEYSQLETRRSEWRFERTDVAALLRAATEMRRPAAAAARIDLACAAAAPALAVVDPARLAEAVGRILDNAVKFTPAGGRIRVELTLHDDLADVAIDDSGPGVPAADRQRVFERFSQVGNLMTDKPRGAGLGLSITQRILDAMGGTIWCEDSPLGGARFRFVLPLAAVAASG